MSNARPWLPRGACFERVDQRIASLAREWGRNWFDTDDIAVGASSRMESWPTARRYPCGSGAWLAVPDETLAAMGRGALHIESGLLETQADRALFDAVGTACFEALRETLVGELSLGRAANHDAVSGRLAPNAVWTIDCKRAGFRLGFVMGEAERIDLLLRLLPMAQPRHGLTSPGVALAPHEVDLAASLGTCGVTLAELRSLSPGDVLVLDRDLSAALPFVIDGVPARAGRGTVTRHAEGLVFEIAEPTSGRNT